jgi:DNA-binding response OmpR family regulator
MQQQDTIIMMTKSSRWTDNNTSTKKILVIDDEDDVNLLFKIVLQNNGFKVDTFSNPLLAIENFKNGLYDLVILDMKMPKMDGLSVYQEIRKLDDKVEICLLTAGDLNDEVFGKEVFPTLNKEDRFIRKPISNEELVKRVKLMTLTE